MNVTLAVALTLLGAWIALVFVAQVPSGYVHLLYAVGMTLLTRRVLGGAPELLSLRPVWRSARRDPRPAAQRRTTSTTPPHATVRHVTRTATFPYSPHPIF